MSFIATNQFLLFKLQYILCIIQSNFKCTRFDEFKTFMVSLNDFTEIDSSFNQRLFVERMNELLFKLESLLSTKRSSKKQDINQIKTMIAEFLFRRLASYDVSIYSFNSKQDGCTIRTLLSYSCFVNNAIRIDLEKYPKASKICLSNIFFDFHNKALDLISLSHALFPSSVDMSVLTNRSLLVDFIKSCSDFMPNRIKEPLTLQKKDYFYLLVFYNNLLQEIGSSLSEVSLVLGIEFRYNLFFRELLIMDACFSDIDKCLRYISLLNTTSMDLLDSSKLEHDLLLNLETTIKQNAWNEVVQHCDVFSYLIMLIEAPLCVSVVKSLFDLTEVANDVGVVETDVVHFFRKQESFPISKGQIEELISILTKTFSMDEFDFFEYLEFYFKVKALDNQSCLVFPGFFNLFFDTIHNALRTDENSIYLDDFFKWIDELAFETYSMRFLLTSPIYSIETKLSSETLEF